MYHIYYQELGEELWKLFSAELYTLDEAEYYCEAFGDIYHQTKFKYMKFN